MIALEPVGFVHNACTVSQVPENIKKEISEIEILPPYAEGLSGVEQCEYLDLLFFFHREKETQLTTRIRTGETKGIFASRSPRRPNHIGATTVKLLRRDGNKLYVEGADALDGSPVIDIKYCDTSLFDQSAVHHSIRKDAPRIDIVRHILDDNLPPLLLQSAQLHGHICPGLALGVMAAAHIMRQIYSEQRNPADFTLTISMKNCPIDGILYVTGFTPGNNRLTLRYSDEMCFEVKDPQGYGWKVQLSPSNRDYLHHHLPSGLSATEKGFAVLKLDFPHLFTIESLPHPPVQSPQTLNTF